MDFDPEEAFGSAILEEHPKQRKRDRSVFGLSTGEDEENTAIKRPFMGNDENSSKTHVVASDSNWESEKARLRDVIFRGMGYRTSPPRGCEFMHVETSSGFRLFATLEADEDSSDMDLYDMKTSKFRGNLLGVPISEIKRLAEEDERTVRQRKLELEEARAQARHESSDAVGSKLWVDKYAPSTFSDLLSDEKTNRNVLIWLKEWSGTVFGERFENPLPRPRFDGTGRFSSPNTQSTHSSGTLGSIAGVAGAVVGEKVAKDRPDQLCILLSGPPGIGKTTLAHIIAKQAGFEAVEFNASDDRTASTFMPKVLDVVGTESRFGSSKPKALIIDEIDGAIGGEGKGAIDALAKFLDEKRLKRPIICICNDLWAPALRPLRDRALSFKLDPPSINSLVSRLDHICIREGVMIDRQLLQVICELTNRDIRSCLNTLQFLSRKSAHITPELFATSSFGNKDMTSNIFEIWKSVFLKEEERTSALQAILDSAARLRRLNNSAEPLELMSRKPAQKARIERISMLVKGATLEKVLDGVHENLLLVKYHDPLFTNTVAITEWFQYYDDLQTSINKKQLFSLFSYLPYVGSAAHILCSTSTSHQAVYPRQASLVRATKLVNSATVEQFIQGMAHPLRPYFDVSSVSLDVASFLVRILSPKLRPVNVTLLTADEKMRLELLVKIHVLYGLEYVEANSMQWDYPEDEERLARWKKVMESFRGRNAPIPMPSVNSSAHLFGLEPPIHRLAHYSAREGTQHLGGTSSSIDFDATSDAVRQMISAQIHAEKLSRLGTGGKTIAFTESDLRRVAEPQPKPDPITKARAAKRAANSPENDTEIVHKDFFGRKIELPVKLLPVKDQKASDLPLALNKPASFFYKYHEGKTDAVRRKVTMKDLM
jgi:DNA polymerase III delta prime subunit